MAIQHEAPTHKAPTTTQDSHRATAIVAALTTLLIAAMTLPGLFTISHAQSASSSAEAGPALSATPSSDAHPGHVKGSLTMTRAYFVSPRDGETVSSPVRIQLGVEGITVKRANGTPTPGEGHFYLNTDGTILEKGQAATEHDPRKHLVKGQQTTRLKLPPGEHRISVQLLDGAHRSYGESTAQTIRIQVK